MIARFVKEDDASYSRNALHMFAENIPTPLHNKHMLISLLGVLHKKEAIDAVPGDCKYSKCMISSAQNRKKTNSGGLPKYLELKKGTKFIVTVNIDVFKIELSMDK